MELPVLIVASLLAVIYGFFISHKWYLALIQGIIMLLSVLLCGRLLPECFWALTKYPGVAQIFGVFLGSVIIFIVFGLRAHARSDKEELEQDKAASSINEEDE